MDAAAFLRASVGDVCQSVVTLAFFVGGEDVMLIWSGV